MRVVRRAVSASWCRRAADDRTLLKVAIRLIWDIDGVVDVVDQLGG